MMVVVVWCGDGGSGGGMHGWYMVSASKYVCTCIWRRT